MKHDPRLYTGYDETYDHNERHAFSNAADSRQGISDYNTNKESLLGICLINIGIEITVIKIINSAV